MKNKKGVSLIISWVLLVGLGVTLAIFATTWARQYAEESTVRIAKMVMKDMRCEDVAFAANYNCSTGKFILKNKGYFTIKYFVLRYNGKSKNIEKEIKPDASTESDTLFISTGKKIELIPVIKVEKEFLGCSDKKITFTITC